jgi:hypothetical protein
MNDYLIGIMPTAAFIAVLYFGKSGTPFSPRTF